MKRAVNLRLEENVIITLDQLTKELYPTKTEVVEKAISLFSKKNNLKQNILLQYAGKLKDSEADKILLNMQNDKNIKDFELDL